MECLRYPGQLGTFVHPATENATGQTGREETGAPEMVPTEKYQADDRRDGTAILVA